MPVSRVLAGCLACLVASSASVALAHDRDAAAEADLLARIQRARAAAHAGALVRDERLDRAAFVHSEDMADHEMLDHVSPRTGDPAARVQAAGVRAAEIAENIVLHRTLEGAHDALMHSPAHRENLEGARYTHVGVAVVRGARGLYITELFARFPEEPAAEAVLPPPASATTTAPEADAEPVAPAAPPAAIEAPRPPAARAQGPVASPGGATFAQAPAAVAAGAARPTRRIRGYWVWSGGRWWYYPIPADARPGQVLRPDPNVRGGPSQPPPSAASPSPFGWSPRRHYGRWRWQ